MTDSATADAAPEGQPAATTATMRGGEWLFSRLPGWVIDTLSTDQKEAVYRAAEDAAWGHHPINIRMSLPLIRRRYYLTVVGGEEKRSAERRAHERHRYPLRTFANVMFFVGLATLVYVAALFFIALSTSIIEF